MLALAPVTRTGNRLLDRLPPTEQARLAPLLEAVALEPRQEMCLPGGPLPHLYFPAGAVFSLVVVMHDGREVEVAAIGREGLVGVSVALGLERMPFRVRCQIPGACWRLPLGRLGEAQRLSPALDQLLCRYAAVALRAACQVTACNALHPVEARLCRWLLLTRERVGADEFPVTQEALASMLGVRRQTVSGIAGALQAAGLIRYSRGVLRIQDPAALARAACECAGALKALYEQVVR